MFVSISWYNDILGCKLPLIENKLQNVFQTSTIICQNYISYFVLEGGVIENSHIFFKIISLSNSL
jgi:hypothetical protein